MLRAINKKKGFTLVELIVVIAVISIISTVTVLGYKNYLINSSKSEDKALINQINRTIESEKLYGDTIEYTIAYILQEMFDGNVDCSSIEYGYDIYYCDDAYQFQLMQKNKHNDENYKNLEHFLTLELNSSETPKYEEPNIPEDSTDNNDDTLVIDLLNIPEYKKQNLTLYIDILTGENRPTSWGFSENQSIDSYEVINFITYNKYKPEDPCKISDNSVYFYSPGVYLVKYINDGISDYYVFFVRNEFVHVVDSSSIGITVNKSNNSFHNIDVNHTISYSENKLIITINNCLHGIVINDYKLSDSNDEGLESLLFQNCQSIFNQITLIIEINGKYLFANFDKASKEYTFSFENIDIGDATTANVIYRYFGNDGIWHYSNTIKVDIN